MVFELTAPECGAPGLIPLLGPYQALRSSWRWRLYISVWHPDCGFLHLRFLYAFSRKIDLGDNEVFWRGDGDDVSVWSVLSSYEVGFRSSLWHDVGYFFHEVQKWGA